MDTQQSFRRACKDVKQDQKLCAPVTTRHKLVVVGSFIRALVSGKLDSARLLQAKYSRLGKVNVEGWPASAEFKDIKDHYI